MKRVNDSHRNFHNDVIQDPKRNLIRAGELCDVMDPLHTRKYQFFKSTQSPYK